MIQTIDIKVKEYCEFGYNLSKKSDWMIGQAYCYDWNTAKEAALKKSLSLDSFLTFQIGYQLAMKNPKGKQDYSDMDADIAGYGEQGQDYLVEGEIFNLLYLVTVHTREVLRSETPTRQAAGHLLHSMKTLCRPWQANGLRGLGSLRVSLITLCARHAFIPASRHGAFCKEGS